jgi:hypothetical protein
VINIIVFLFIESVEVCSDNETNNNKSLFLITFGFGWDEYSKETPDSFNFSTTHNQTFAPKISDGLFAFVNAVPSDYPEWQSGQLDHTQNNDKNGYMYLVNVGPEGSQLFNSTVDNLCIGLCYEFSAYLTNIRNTSGDYAKPNIHFEVRNATAQSDLLAQCTTNDIDEYEPMIWSQYGLSFVASTSSVVLLIISDVVFIPKKYGNDLAVDDIELRVCSTVHPCFYSSS